MYTKGKISGGKGLVEKRKVANDKDVCYLPVSQWLFFFGFFFKHTYCRSHLCSSRSQIHSHCGNKREHFYFSLIFCAQKHKTIKEENDGANTFRLNSLFSAVLKDYYWKIPSC